MSNELEIGRQRNFRYAIYTGIAWLVGIAIGLTIGMAL